MDIAALAIKNRVVTLVLTVVMLFAGISSFNDMSRLEDPEFTIKDALVMTPYPGASAEEVEQEVSDLPGNRGSAAWPIGPGYVQIRPRSVDAYGHDKEHL